MYPRITKDLPEGGKVTGTLEYAVTNGTHVHISGDDITYRAARYSVGIHAHQQADGTWSATLRPDGTEADRVFHPNVEKRFSDYPYRKPAAPTIQAAIVAAIMETVSNVVTDRMLADAALYVAEGKHNEAARDVERLESELSAARLRLGNADLGLQFARSARDKHDPQRINADDRVQVTDS